MLIEWGHDCDRQDFRPFTRGSSSCDTGVLLHCHGVLFQIRGIPTMDEISCPVIVNTAGNNDYANPRLGRGQTMR